MSKKERPALFFCLAIIIFWGAAVFFLILGLYDTNLSSLSREFLTAFYRPDYNNTYFGEIAGINVVVYIYGAILLSTITIHILRARIFRARPWIPLLSILQLATSIMLGLIVLFQITNQIFRFAFEHRTYAAQPLEERFPGNLKTIYEFASFCRDTLPGEHSARFLSKMDISRDPGMFLQRALAYYLYPIDIRNIRGDSEDSLVIWGMLNPEQSVPDDFKIIGVFDTTSLLAVKKGKNQ